MAFLWNKRGVAGAPASKLAAELVPNGRIRGSAFKSRVEGDCFEIGGWLLHPMLPIDSVKLSVNGTPVATGPVRKREDVAKTFAMIPHAGDSGFEARCRLPTGGGQILRLGVEGTCNGAPVGWIETHHAIGADSGRLFPSTELMQRVAGTQTPRQFAYAGINLAMDLTSAADKHLGLANVKTLLDFGCGSGRVSHYLMKLYPNLQLSGCDIDAQAIAWDNENIRDGAFKTMSLTAPLPYADASFDAAVAVSVMTHLELAEQHKWLSEVARVIRPGGLFLPSMNGAFAAHFVPGMVEALELLSITDQTRDEALTGVAPAGYYRSTFQLPSFTKKEWSRHFEVVEIIQAGCGEFQDLAVLRKK
jgi:SAM-dependent methyltransferase